MNYEEVGRIMNYSKKNPCPICGKTDYCGWVYSQNGILVTCHREIEGIKNSRIEGKDGKVYIYQKEKNGCGIYEEEEQLKRARMDYFGYKTQNRPKSNFSNKKQGNIQIKCKNKNLTQFIANKQVLNNVYKSFISNFKLSELHIKKLKSDGWSTDMIKESGYVSFPDYETVSRVVAELSSKFDLKGVPGFYKVNNEWVAKYYTGMIIPVYDIEGYIIRLRIRPDWTKKQIENYKKNGKKPPKYLFFSSYKEKILADGKVVNELDFGTRSGATLSYIFEKGDSFETLGITEGEKKGKVVNLLRRIPCASIPGVTTYGKVIEQLPELRKKGLKRVIIFFDADKIFNEDVKKAELNFIEQLKENDVEVIVATWQLSDGKGIDDLLLSGKIPKLILK